MLQTSSGSGNFKTKYYKERMLNEQLSKQINSLEYQETQLQNENQELKSKIEDMTE